MIKILPYDPMVTELLELEQKKFNPFLEDATHIPLGTRRPLNEYDSDEEIINDIVYFDIGADNFAPTLIIGLSGSHKSVLMKRLEYYLHKSGNHIVIFDLKTIEAIKSAYKPRSTAGLLPQELPDYLPIKAFVPSYIMNEIPENLKPHLKNIITAPKISDWKREDFYTLDFSATGVEILKMYFKKGWIDPLKILKRLPYDKMAGQPATRAALIRRLAALIDNNFIIRGYPTPNIEKVWNEGKVPTFHFLSQSQQAMSFYVSLVIQSMWQYAQKTAEPTTIFIGDAPLVCGMSEQGKPRPAAETILKVLTMWRSLKINLIMETQSPDLIVPSVLGNFQYFLLSRTDNVESLRRAGFSAEIIKVANTLIRDKSAGIFEYMLIKEDRSQYERFFSTAPPVGHFGNLLKNVNY